MTDLNKMTAEPGSFRDRNGRIFYFQDAVYRAISQQALEEWNLLTATKFFPQALADHRLVRTELADPDTIPNDLISGSWAGVLRHERLPFISYPYEWSFGMLKDAALLQLELLERALAEDMTMKDCTSYNIQWNGSLPIFIDIPSFQRLLPGTPWVGYKQFCELFLYPLMLQAYKEIPFHYWLRGRIDGIDPVDMNKIMGFADRFRAGVFADVYLQAKLQERYASSTRRVKDELRATGFRKEMIASNLRRLKKVVQNLEWKRSKSEWSDYTDEHNYDGTDAQLKIDFVRQAAHTRSWDLAWDLGCNTGTFSRILAEKARFVVAMDYDHLAVDRLYTALKREQNTKILPLVMNLADASPGLGWRGSERKPFTGRGKPDLILALALLHHVVISANIPLEEFIDWLASLGSDLVIEFVAKSDAMTQRLLKNKEDQYSDYEKENFERCLRKHYVIERCQTLTSGNRFLYFARALKTE